MISNPASDELNQISNAASNVIADAIIEEAAQAQAEILDAGGVFFAVVCGAITGALKVLNAAAEAGTVHDADSKVDALLRQAADTWGQINGERPAGGTVQ
ncbi:hypothetical protein ACLBWH_12210 [Sphingomonas sp. M6A6_1c]